MSYGLWSVINKPATPIALRKDSIKAFLNARSGSPSIEFALLAPVMVVLLTGSYDIAQSLVALRQVTGAAHEIVEIASELSVQPDLSISLTANQTYQAQTAIYALLPRLKSGRDVNKFSVTLSAVVFTPLQEGCAPGMDCNPVANTAWSSALPQGIETIRPCGVVAQVDARQPATINNLTTAGITTMTSILVADVSYVYQPLFIGFITGAITLRQTAFLPPRSGKPTQYVRYDPGNTKSKPIVCPGFR